MFNRLIRHCLYEAPDNFLTQAGGMLLATWQFVFKTIDKSDDEDSQLKALVFAEELITQTLNRILIDGCSSVLIREAYYGCLTFLPLIFTEGLGGHNRDVIGATFDFFYKVLEFIYTNSPLFSNANVLETMRKSFLYDGCPHSGSFKRWLMTKHGSY